MLCGDQLDDRQADVAADLRWQAGVREDLADQGGGGGLAVRAGDRDDLALEKPARQFQLADDGKPEGRYLLDLRRVQRTPGETTIRSCRRKVSRPWPPARP